ncbi:MAG: ComEC/Rec2 family competence protein [Marinilabiliaceae bacterium]|nr:ComEC/Rec2 family competence protein [Marinilabiliaceae bacterium]
MVFLFRQYPLFLLVLLFIPGVWFGVHVQTEMLAVVFVVICCLYIFYTFFIVHKRSLLAYKNRWLPGVLIGLLMFCSGLFYSSYRLPNVLLKPVTFYGNGEIVDVVGISEKSVRVNVKFKNVCDENKSCNTSLRVMAFFPIKYLSMLEVGNTIEGEISLSPFDKPSVPFQFDYGSYLSYAGYSAIGFIKDTIVIGERGDVGINRFINQLRIRFKNTFKKETTDKTSLSVLQAMVLGDRDLISYETRTQYIKSGAIHILAVSGLHVGVIYLVLLSLFGFLKRGAFKIVKVIVLLCILWFYAWLTMFSPSVMRATIMFSVVLIGRELMRDTNVYYSLSISAFIILIINPLSVYHVGFWLSHLAVVGIVTFYNSINNWFYFSFVGWRWIWSIVAVSLSAQITTFPLIILLFQGFPIYFLITNVFLIPILPVVLIGGIVMLVVPVNSVVNEILTNPINDLLAYMNKTVEVVSGFPGAFFTGFTITISEMLLLYVVILFLSLFFRVKNPQLLLIGKMAVVLFLTLFLNRIVFASQQQILSLYSKGGKHIVNYIDGFNNITICSNTVQKKELGYIFESYWNHCFVKNDKYYCIDSLFDNRTFLLIIGKSKKIGIVRKGGERDGNSIRKMFSNGTPVVDVLICLGARNEFEEVLNCIKRKELICFSTYNYQSRKKKKSTIYEEHEKYIDMGKDNFYQLKY